MKFFTKSHILDKPSTRISPNTLGDDLTPDEGYSRKNSTLFLVAPPIKVDDTSEFHPSDSESYSIASTPQTLAPTGQFLEIHSISTNSLDRKGSDAFLVPPLSISEKYDPHNFGKTNDAMSRWGIVCHIFLISTGPGLLTIPSNFLQVDYISGFVIIFLVIWLYVYCVNTVLWSEYELCKIKQRPHLPNLDKAFSIFGDGKLILRLLAFVGRWLSYFAFIVAWFGYSCYDYYIISQNMQIFCTRLFRNSFSSFTMLCILFLPLLGLCSVRSLRKLVPFSCIGNVFNAVSYLLVVTTTVTNTPQWQLTRNFGTISDLGVLAGSVLSDINGLGLLLLFKNEMRKPKEFSASFGTINMSFIPISLIYLSYIMICVLRYGTNIHGNIFQNLPKGHPTSILGIACGIIGQMFQFPLTIFVPFDTIWNIIFGKNNEETSNQRWEYGLKVILIVATFLVCASIPRPMLILSFCGAICGTIEILIIPPLIETLVISKTNKSRFDFWLVCFKNLCIVLFAVWLIVVQTNGFITALSSGTIISGSAFWIYAAKSFQS